MRSGRRRGRRQKERGPEEIEDAIGRWSEWGDHQYQAGYYTGGRIPPLFTGQGASPYGRILVFSGATILAVLLFSLAVGLVGLIGSPWNGLLTRAILFLFLLLALVAGIRLLQGERRPRTSRHRRE